MVFYIMSNSAKGVLYIVVTNNIEEMNPSWTDLSSNWNLNYNKFRN